MPHIPYLEVFEWVIHKNLWVRCGLKIITHVIGHAHFVYQTGYDPTCNNSANNH